MQTKTLAAPLFAALLALSACGSTDIERGVVGAAAGAVGASILGGDPVVGAAVGGAGGVFCDDINLCR